MNASNTNSRASNLLILTPIYLFFFFFFFFLFFSFLLIPINCDSPPRYHPPDNIALACGTSGRPTDPGGRTWDGDIDSNLYSLEENLGGSSSKSAPYSTQIAPIPIIPYSTARISRSQFTFVFSLTSSGPKFIRLHFCRSWYQDFNPSKAFFSVKANQFTLLSNFSASLTANWLGKETIVNEFCINLGDGEKIINITFAPSNTPSDAYAFINGIEIVSLPTDLYYGSGEPQGITFIGNNNQLYPPLENNTALEMVHRLNVGGQAVWPMQDTGMYRTWILDDGYYNFMGAVPLLLNQSSIQLKFTKIRNYTAPDEVYKSARSMGNDGAQNQHYNLTWNLPVDSGFTYLVRLHFCEFQSQITQIGDRQFIIYIANQTADEAADVIRWSSENSVPVYRDYALIMNQGNGKKQNLSIALHSGKPGTTVYHDAILNGIEVFKISSFDGNLAGPNPDSPPPLPLLPPPTPSNQQPKNPKTKHSSTSHDIAAICAGVFSSIIVLSVLFLLIFRRRRRRGQRRSRAKNDSLSLPSDSCRHFSLAEIKTATNDFNSILIIGRGGFGDVYKGYINDGTTPVAIKRLKPGSKQGAPEFMAEINMLSQLRYLHLVSLIGYCNDHNEMILVYDFMTRGTLCDHLYNTDNPPLTWNQRLQICIGAAKGLHYLHAGAKHMIIHRDVKSTNILLDEKWVAKISDFGLSKINPKNLSNAHISTAVKGSLGYLDPEYWRRQQLTEKSDVYSFGVVLLEVLCGRPPINKKLQRDEVNLAGWARKCYENGTFDQIVDTNLKVLISSRCLEKFREIVMSCLHDEGIQRPSMSDVVWGLEFALQLQESAEEGIKADGDYENNEENAFLFGGGDVEMVQIRGGQVSNSVVTMTSNSGTSLTSISSHDKMSSGAVFSEIFNPKAR